MTIGRAPSVAIRLLFASERVVPATSCPACTNSGSSRLPTAPLAPATRIRTRPPMMSYASQDDFGFILVTHRRGFNARKPTSWRLPDDVRISVCL